MLLTVQIDLLVVPIDRLPAVASFSGATRRPPQKHGKFDYIGDTIDGVCKLIWTALIFYAHKEEEEEEGEDSLMASFPLPNTTTSNLA